MGETHFLEEVDDLEFSVLAINSHDKGYGLCWHINKALSMNFRRRDSTIFPENEIFTSFEDLEGESRYVLIANKSKKGFLVTKKKKIDFFIKIEPPLSLKEKEEFIQKLNKISKILLIFELDLQKEQEAHRFIFND